MSTLTELASSNIVTDAVRVEVGVLFWNWYHSNLDRKITHVHMWLFSRDIYVRDLYDLFVLLFGPEPQQS